MKEPKMVFIKGGTFQMGSPDGDSDAYDDEKPQHQITVPDFYLGERPVTFLEYDLFCAYTLRRKPSDFGWGRENRPVVDVDWDDANAYCRWLESETGRPFRLPTEAEWEFAARGGVGGYDSNSKSRTRPIGQKDANELGLRDMIGNVYEWCEDYWHENYNGNPPTDGSAWIDRPQRGSARVLRGGYRGGTARDYRATHRNYYAPDNRNGSIGFRPALCVASSVAG